MSVKKFGAFAANPGTKKKRKTRKGKAAAPRKRRKKAAASAPASPKKRRTKRKSTARKSTARKSHVRSLALYSASKKGKKKSFKRVGSVRVKSNAGEKIDWGRLAIDAGIGGAAALFVSYAAAKVLESKGGDTFKGGENTPAADKRNGAAGLIAAAAGGGIAYFGHKKHNKMAKRIGLAMAFVGGGLAVQGFAGSKLKEWAGQLPGIKGLGGVYAQPTQPTVSGMLLSGIQTNVGGMAGMYSLGNDQQAVMAGTSPFTQTQFG